jgi:hypothetical protein
MRRIPLLLALVVLFVACGFSFESSTTIIDQRILGISAEPAQLTPAVKGAVTMSALIVDPTTTAPVSIVTRVCLIPAGSTGVSVGSGNPGNRGPGSGLGGLGNVLGGGGGGNQETLANVSSVQPCPDDSPIVAMTTQPLGTASVSLGLPGQLEAALVGSSQMTDGGMGAGSGGDGGFSLGLIPVDLEVDLRTTGDGGQTAVKAIPITLVLPPGDVANQNPQMQGVTFDGEAWTDGTPLQIAYGNCPTPQRSRPTGGASAVCQHTIVPLYDFAQSETFHLEASDGGWVAERERLTFSWFTTQGTFQRTTTAQATPGESTSDIGLNSTWSEPDQKTGPVTFWFVMRDGRGGASWITRQVVFQ